MPSEEYEKLKAEVKKMSRNTVADIGRIQDLSAEIERLQSEIRLLKNQNEYLDQKLDDEMESCLDYSRTIKAIYDKVQDAKNALDKCPELPPEACTAWRILKDLLTPPPLP